MQRAGWRSMRANSQKMWTVHVHCTYAEKFVLHNIERHHLRKSHHNQICIFLDSWAWRVRAAGRAAPPQSPASWTGASPPSTLAWLGPPATHPGWPAATPPSTARAVSPPPRSPAPTPAWQQPACSGRARPLCSLSTRPRLPAPGRSSGQQSSH